MCHGPECKVFYRLLPNTALVSGPLRLLWQVYKAHIGLWQMAQLQDVDGFENTGRYKGFIHPGLAIHNLQRSGDCMTPSPANTRHWPNVVLMLGRRRRRRASIKTTLGQCIVFAGYRGYDIWTTSDGCWDADDGPTSTRSWPSVLLIFSIERLPQSDLRPSVNTGDFRQISSLLPGRLKALSEGWADAVCLGPTLAQYRDASTSQLT